MINQEQAQELWASELESGKHKQGTGRLQLEDCYCCLGIGCLVAEKHGVFVGRSADSGGILGGGLTVQADVMAWLGLQDGNGHFLEIHENMDPPEQQASLIWLNDRRRLTFKEIAAIVRSKPEGLFI